MNGMLIKNNNINNKNKSKDIIFSIIIPSYNCESLIEKTLQSIIIQEDLYECIVVDGLSNDNTIEIVKKYSEINHNIKYISEKDNGIYDAMNKGISIAKGKYLYFIGAGDILYSNTLKEVNEEIIDEDLIYGRSYHVGKEEEIYRPKRKSDIIYYNLNHQAIFYKRDIFNKVGLYDEKYSIYADNILNKKIFADDNLVKKIIDVRIADYLGGGVSENEEIQDNFYRDFPQIIVSIFGKNYLKKLYNPKKFENKRLIAWGNGGEYKKADEYKNLPINYFVKSSLKSEEIFNGVKVFSREVLLNEKKEEIFILVYSKKYYSEIRKWLEKNGFKEFDNFMLMTRDVLRVINKVNNK